MTKPVYKIETYTGAVLDHTIEKEVISVHVKERVTSAPGIFSFAVPSKKNGDTYYYNDIVVDDKVKIYLGYKTISASDLVSVGKILNISAPLSTQLGYIRVFTGKNQGEILERRQKTKYWGAIGASTIVTELANDLSLGTGDIVADATAVTLAAANEPYWRVLQRISDYWFNAGTQIKKDFYVDIDNDLVWKARPIRTSGVEMLTVGDNIISYVVTRDVKSVKNKIYVYGAKTKTYPLTDIDSLTNSTTDWAVDAGDNIATSSDRKSGSVSIDIYDNDGGAGAWRDNIGTQKALFPHRDQFTHLNFWFKVTDTAAIPVPYIDIHLYCNPSPTITDGFLWDIGWNTVPCSYPLGTWLHVSLPLGPHHEGAAEWTQFGSGTWDDIESLHFNVLDVDGSATVHLYIDECYFSGARFYALADAGASVVREYTVIDDTLLTDADCQKRAKTLLYQLQDTPIRIDVLTRGNTNLLIGDRLSLTIAAEGISASNYDIVEVDHNVLRGAFTTSVKTVDTANKRALPPTTQNEVLKEQFNIQKEIARGIQIIK